MKFHFKALDYLALRGACDRWNGGIDVNGHDAGFYMSLIETIDLHYVKELASPWAGRRQSLRGICIPEWGGIK